MFVGFPVLDVRGFVALIHLDERLGSFFKTCFVRVRKTSKTCYIKMHRFLMFHLWAEHKVKRYKWYSTWNHISI